MPRKFEAEQAGALDELIGDALNYPTIILGATPEQMAQVTQNRLAQEEEVQSAGIFAWQEACRRNPEAFRGALSTEEAASITNENAHDILNRLLERAAGNGYVGIQRRTGNNGKKEIAGFTVSDAQRDQLRARAGRKLS